MAQHDKKHKLNEVTKTLSAPSVAIPKNGVPAMLQQLPQPQGAPLNLSSPSNQQPRGTTMISPLSPVSVTPPPAHGAVVKASTSPQHKDVVKTKGTFFPSSGLSAAATAAVNAAIEATKAKMAASGQALPVGLGGTATSAPILVTQAPGITMTAGNLITIAPKPRVQIAGAQSANLPAGVNPAALGGINPAVGGLPLTMLLQQKGPNSVPQLNWLTMKMKMHFDVTQNCGRPFCKLKKKDHYHCYDCNQAFSDPVRLRSHVVKHGLKVDKSENVQHPMLNPALLNNPALSGLSARLQVNNVNANNNPLSEPQKTEDKVKNTGGRILNISREDAHNYSSVNNESEDDEFTDEEDVNPSSSLNLNPNTFSTMLNKSASSSLRMNEDSQEATAGASSTGGPVGRIANQALNLAILTNGRQNFSDEEVDAQNENEEVEKDLEKEMEADEEEEEEKEKHNGINEENLEENKSGMSVTENVNGDNEHDAGEGDDEQMNESIVENVDGKRSRRSGRKRSAPKPHTDFINSDTAYAKQRKIDLSSKGKVKNAPTKGSRTSPRAKVNEQREIRNSAHGKLMPPIVNTADTNNAQVNHANVEMDPAKLQALTDQLNEVNALISQEKEEDAKVLSAPAKVGPPPLEGFKWHQFTEDCGVVRCAYRYSSSHWHCMKPHCAYGMSDRSRATAHLQKHATMQELLGEDFEHYSAKSNCDRPDCEHAMTTAHFHCLKCAFITTITNKVQVRQNNTFYFILFYFILFYWGHLCNFREEKRGRWYFLSFSLNII